MPKPKKSHVQLLKDYVSQFSCFKTDESILFCRFCDTDVSIAQRGTVLQHMNTKKHKERAAGAVPNEKPKEQQLISNQPPASSSAKDLTNFFVCNDIALSKIRQKFLKDYTKQVIPSETTLRVREVPRLFRELLDHIKVSVKNEYLWLSMDETLDSEKRCIVNVILGILSEDKEKAAKKFLLKMEVAEKVNSSVISQLCQSALESLGPDFKRSSVLLFLSDAAPYMVKAGTSIAEFYPKMTHVTCIIHGLNRVCGKIRAEFDNVNELISNVKKVFIKAPNRIRLFRAICPDLTLPPEPVITRWGTWLTAAIYYADNYSDISAVIEALDGEEAVAIERTKKILTDCHLKRDLNLIKIHFGFLVDNDKTASRTDGNGGFIEPSERSREKDFGNQNSSATTDCCKIAGGIEEEFGPNQN